MKVLSPEAEQILLAIQRSTGRKLALDGITDSTGLEMNEIVDSLRELHIAGMTYTEQCVERLYDRGIRYKTPKRRRR